MSFLSSRIAKSGLSRADLRGRCAIIAIGACAAGAGDLRADLLPNAFGGVAGGKIIVHHRLKPRHFACAA